MVGVGEGEARGGGGGKQGEIDEVQNNHNRINIIQHFMWSVT